MISIDL